MLIHACFGVKFLPFHWCRWCSTMALVSLPALTTSGEMPFLLGVLSLARKSIALSTSLIDRVASSSSMICRVFVFAAAALLIVFSLE